MTKIQLLDKLIRNLNTSNLIAENENDCEIRLRFEDEGQVIGVMSIHKYVNDGSGYVVYNGIKKQLSGFERFLLMGLVSANHHKILYF